MKALLIAWMLTLGLMGCSAYQPDWSEYHGPSVMRGNGGTTTEVDGMEVWNEGTPPRPYRILGTMRSEGGRWSDEDFELKLIAKAARTKGADALILLNSESRMEGINLYSGRFIRMPDVTAVLIKYL